MSTCCTCDLCRRAVKIAIERVFLAAGRCLLWNDIVWDASLTWVPGRFLVSVFAEMVRRGLVIRFAWGRQAPVYLLAWQTLPAYQGRAES